MYLFFCLKINRKEFKKLPGAALLLQKMEDAGIPWGYQEALEEREDLSAEDFLDGKEKDCILVTDDRQLAEKWKKRGVCCIGYQEQEDTAFFNGAMVVISSFEELSPVFFLQAFHHFHGIPLVITETERLVIRESCMDDFEKLYQISREEGSDRYTETMIGDYDREREKFQAYITHAYAYYGFGLWTVLEKKTGEILGRCGLSVVSDEYSPEGRLELGYLIGRDYRGKGYALEACRGILKYIGDIWAYAGGIMEENGGISENGGTSKDGGMSEDAPIYAVIHRENLPSVKLAERLGFQLHGRLDEERMLYRYK